MNLKWLLKKDWIFEDDTTIKIWNDKCKSVGTKDSPQIRQLAEEGYEVAQMHYNLHTNVVELMLFLPAKKVEMEEES